MMLCKEESKNFKEKLSSWHSFRQRKFQIQFHKNVQNEAYNVKGYEGII